MNSLRLRRVLPRYITTVSNNKHEYIEKLNNQLPILVCSGPTGSGKTFLSCREGILQVKEKKYKKILITRPSVGIDNEEYGFLPGTMNAKMHHWMEPIYQNIVEEFGNKYLDTLQKNKLIEIVPLMYLRGRTFNDSFVIADEMQNSTVTQFKTILTRMGQNAKIVLTGDLDQSDIYNNTNGLDDFISRHSKMELKYSELVFLSNDDIVRSDCIKEILSMYSRDNNNNFMYPW